MTVITLYFLKGGIVRGLYTEAINLGALGNLRIERASRIEFDNRRQSWRVLNCRGRCLHSASSREECLEWERTHFTHKEEIEVQGA